MYRRTAHIDGRREGREVRAGREAVAHAADGLEHDDRMTGCEEAAERAARRSTVRFRRVAVTELRLDHDRVERFELGAVGDAEYRDRRRRAAGLSESARSGGNAVLLRRGAAIPSDAHERSCGEAARVADHAI